MTLDVTTVMPEGFDPNHPDANRHTYAQALLAEAKTHLGAVERFVVLMATIKNEGLFKLLGYKTYDAMVIAEFGRSARTGQRWVEQGNALATGEGPPKAIGPGQTATRASQNGIGIEPPEAPRISQREAARKARERREATKPEPPPGIQPSEPSTPGAEPPGRVPRGPRKPPPGTTEVEAAVKAVKDADEASPGPGRNGSAPEPSRPDPADEWEYPSPSPAAPTEAEVARANLTDLLGFMGKLKPAELAAVATQADREAIQAFAAHFVVIPARVSRRQAEPGIDPKDCKHPINRRIGSMCGACRQTGLK